MKLHKGITAYWLIVAFLWGCVIFLSPTSATQLEPPEMEFWMTGYTKEEGFDENTRTINGTIPGYGTVASDPTMLPYGSIVFWPEYSNGTPGGHYGTVLDCGSAVKGYHLDFWYETNAEAAKMTKTATALILRWGWDRWLCDPRNWGLE